MKLRSIFAAVLFLFILGTTRSVLFGQCQPPTITSQPQDQTIDYLQTATLSVSATFSGSVRYQWWEDFGTAPFMISGATSDTYTTPNLFSDARYFVTITDSCGTSQSRTATIFVNPCEPPKISSEPQDQTVIDGQTATLSVAVTGTSPFSYQWYEGTTGDTSTPAAGASTSSSYTTPPLSSTKQYWVEIFGQCDAPAADSRTATVTVVPCTPPEITSQPEGATIEKGESLTLSVSATGTGLSYQWYEGLSGDTSKPVAGATASTFTTPPLSATKFFWVRVNGTCGSVDSEAALVRIPLSCEPPVITAEPQDRTIDAGTSVTFLPQVTGSGPLLVRWYQGEAGDRSTPAPGLNGSLNYTTPVLSATTSYWAEITNDCGSAQTRTVTVTVNLCAPDGPAGTIASAPSSVPDGREYEVSWLAVEGASAYEIEESLDAEFHSSTTSVVSGLSASFSHAPGSQPVPFYYRVRPIAECNAVAGAFSPVVRVVILPEEGAPSPPPAEGLEVAVPVDSTEPVVFEFLLLPPPNVQSANFSITTDVEWLSVTPVSGTVSAAGVNVVATADPTEIPLGANFGTIIVSFDFPAKSGGGIAVNDNTSSSIPVNVSLVTPVAPVPKSPAPPGNTLIIPAVAHTPGIGAEFVSDVRITNTAGQPVTYDLTFTPSSTNGTQVGKKTTLTIQPNTTLALDDVLKLWYGVGTASDDAKGMLEIRPKNFSGKGGPDAVTPFATVASSRTYARTAAGTLGQFIPAIPFVDFIGKSTDPGNPSVLSLQQIAQSTAARTNLGLVEGSGQPAAVLISVFNDGGQKLAEFAETLQAGEHRQLDQYLATKGMTLSDGRVEVRVTSDTGRVSAYASVIDNITSDPLLVAPIRPNSVSSTKFVIAGVADIQNALASFRSDMRIYNPSPASVNATLLFYPVGSPGTPIEREVPIAAGETKVLNNVLASLFGVSGTTGAVHVESPVATPLVVTARTYDQRTAGTYGQFIPAATAESAVGVGDRSLQVLQLEESESFRTNLGLAEVSGQPVTVTLTGIDPNARIAPVLTVNLAANEFLQLNQVFRQMNLERVYNGRITVRVIGGTGRVFAYGSVVDNQTQDPTYVPGQ